MDVQRTIVMTGGTHGLGRVAAVRILQGAPDAHLVLIGRSDGEAIARKISIEAGSQHVSSVTADLSSLASIRVAAAAIRVDIEAGTLPPLTGLVGNAGLQLLRASDVSADGVEATFAVNVLANHVLVDELLPVLSAPARIVITTSDTHFGDLRHNLGLVPAPRWRDPAALASPDTGDRAESAAAGRRAYATSKLAVIYLVHALARRVGPGVEVYSFNPGLVPGTGLARHGGAAARFAFGRIMPAMTVTPWARSVEVSGADLAAAALGPVPGPSGSYLNGTRVEASSPESYDPAREDALWDILTHLTATTTSPKER